ncbi:MAG: hypothetical protein GYB64_11300, partial [Chloroflexi bacterium]|nr:hypothetical protein [Chloroflexota bacterium]
MIVYTLHQGLFTAVGLASFVALFVFGATLAAGSRLIVQILRSRPRPRAHPIDSLPLLPPTAADA